jgi:hypothetical protein
VLANSVTGREGGFLLFSRRKIKMKNGGVFSYFVGLKKRRSVKYEKEIVDSNSCGNDNDFIYGTCFCRR